MRLFPLEVSGGDGLRGLLYPGCTVDILVSLQSRDGGKIVSKPLLERVQVMAIGGKTVSSPEEKDEKISKNAANSKKMQVTVEVTIEQAQELQSAKKRGTFSLVLRNPEDFAISSTDDKKKPDDKDKRPITPRSPQRPVTVTVIHGQETKEIEFPASK